MNTLEGQLMLDALEINARIPIKSVWTRSEEGQWEKDAEVGVNRKEKIQEEIHGGKVREEDADEGYENPGGFLKGAAKRQRRVTELFKIKIQTKLLLSTTLQSEIFVVCK